MKYALAEFRVYLLGSGPFVVYTDGHANSVLSLFNAGRCCVAVDKLEAHSGNIEDGTKARFPFLTTTQEDLEEMVHTNKQLEDRLLEAFLPPRADTRANKFGICLSGDGYIVTHSKPASRRSKRRSEDTESESVREATTTGSLNFARVCGQGQPRAQGNRKVKGKVPASQAKGKSQHPMRRRVLIAFVQSSFTTNAV
ncbi:hypothetical protein PI124_g5839 [Phytophthora idaei]|nr:hypothetical protein PI125_g10656 [Phytophthora idaei]KAG3140454.1 hypothetical protein PI126_g16001 [Phytophthora idaei]KAG3249520.1 hypothetical protein PI124_g5839 [Phytophthora idaei]